jgi:micrococcal nuclease
MKTKLLTILLALSVCLNVYLILQSQRAPSEPATPLVAEPDSSQSTAESAFESGSAYPFIRVVDGDTVIVGIRGESKYVRLIGIDAPEPNVSSGPECYATEATEHLKEIARTGSVVLHYDESQGTYDKFSRILAYVQLPDGTDLGERMLRDGYAREFMYDAPYARRDAYLSAEQDAMSTEAGLWSPETCK